MDHGCIYASDTTEINLSQFSANEICVNASSEKLGLSSSTSSRTQASIGISSLHAVKGYPISNGGNYDAYLYRTTSSTNKYENIQIISGETIQELVEFYSEKYPGEGENGKMSEEEVMEAISKDGIRFSKTGSTTNPKADKNVRDNMDTAARAYYGMQAGVDWKTENIGYKFGNDGEGAYLYDQSAKASYLNKASDRVVEGTSVINNYDNIVIIPFNPADEPNEYELYIQYKKKEWDENTKKCKDAVDAQEFAGNSLVKVQNSDENKDVEVEVLDEPVTESGETFYEHADLEKATYNIIAKSSFELDSSTWKIVKEECKYSIGEDISEAASNLNKSTKVLEKNSFEYTFGEEGKKTEVMTLRIVYEEEPLEEEEEGDPKVIELFGFALTGKLQFINVTNTDKSYKITGNSLASNSQPNDGSQSLNSSLSGTYEFINSTASEDSAGYDYIPAGEYISPYVTDAYSYIIRAMSWRVKEEEKTISKTVTVSRTGEYILRWSGQAVRDVPTFTGAKYGKGREYVLDDKFKFNANSENSEATGTYIKYWLMDKTMCPYATGDYSAMADHNHKSDCCPGLTFTSISTYESFNYTCPTTESQYYFYTYMKDANGNSKKVYYVNGVVWALSTAFASKIRESDSMYNSLANSYNSESAGTWYCKNSITVSYNGSDTITNIAGKKHSDTQVREGYCASGKLAQFATTCNVSGKRTCTKCGKNIDVSGKDISCTTTYVGHSTGVDCTWKNYYNSSSYKNASTNTNTMLYYGHYHDISCFDAYYNGSKVNLSDTQNSKYLKYVSDVSKLTSDDQEADRQYTGINHKSTIGKEVKSQERNYDIKYVMKYYNIEQFRMYKIKNMAFNMTPNYGGPIFENNNNLEKDDNGDILILPSQKYEDLFSNANNKIVKLSRSDSFSMDTTLNLDDVEDKTYTEKKDTIVNSYKTKLNDSGLADKNVTFGRIEGTNTSNIYKGVVKNSYVGANGENGGYADSMKGYRSFERQNIFLADTKGTKLETLFNDLLEFSVKAITDTEVALRCNPKYTITNNVNDSFTFTKDYSKSLSINAKSFASYNYSDTSTSDNKLLDQNEKWKGTVVYEYTWENGMQVNGEEVKNTETLMDQKAFLTKNSDEVKEKDYTDEDKLENELNKLFDATNFKNVEDAYKYANGNKEVETTEFGDSKDFEGNIVYGLDGTYVRGEDPENSSNSSYTYTKNYSKFADSTQNKHLTDIFDWSLVNMKTAYQLNNDGVGNGKRMFSYKLTYELVDEEMNKNLYIDEDEKYEDKTIAYYTNYTEEGTQYRKKADDGIEKQQEDAIYVADKNFTDTTGKYEYGRNIESNSLTKVGSTINILSPVKIKDANVSTGDIINQFIKNENGTEQSFTLGKNTEFLVGFSTDKSNADVGYGINSEGVETEKYTKQFMIVCDFDCVCIENCSDHEEGFGMHPAYSAIIVKPGVNIQFKGKTTSSYTNNAIGNGERIVKIFDVANNIPNNVLEKVKELNFNTSNFIYTDKIYNKKRQTGGMNHTGLYTTTMDDAYHISYNQFSGGSIFRIYDFAITDFTDILYKDVFRTGVTPTNEYYAGKRAWRFQVATGIEGTFEQEFIKGDPLTYSNNMDERKSTLILPVGPNSNTKNPAYNYAPKLGYTFSFDLKTTGYLSDNNKSNTRQVIIKPRFYYVSKSGEYIEDIKLYYKNSNGTYVRFENSGYKIAMKPNDGYRNLRLKDIDGYSEYTFSSETQYLNISDTVNGFRLDNKFMTTSYGSFVQTWYGEFKLPNSTIVVKEGGNLNSPLTNGYIGVCFDIICEDTATGQIISYQVDNKGQVDNGINTSQWDFEGNFGKDFGSAETFNYKSFWNIDNDTWQKVKSTVVLYDTDLRADDDFQ